LERPRADINDQVMVHEISHDDVMLEFPQGGERVLRRSDGPNTHFRIIVPNPPPADGV
jgi:hypothetical protein